MSEEAYCRLLLGFKDDGVRYRSYFGLRWLILKLLLAATALLMLLAPYKDLRPVALLLLGYLVGVVSSGLKSYIVTKKRWELQRQFMDWEKIGNSLGERALS